MKRQEFKELNNETKHEGQRKKELICRVKDNRIMKLYINNKY